MNLNELQEAIEVAITPEFRERLLAKGQARSKIWRDGELQSQSPNFTPNLSYDLKSYGYSLFSMAIRLREAEGDETLMRTAFEHSANAIEAVITKGDPSDPERGFHRLLAASAFHLGHFFR